MAELDFPLGKTPTVRLRTDGIEVLFTMTGDADDLWCDLFTMVERPSDPDVNGRSSIFTLSRTLSSSR